MVVILAQKCAAEGIARGFCIFVCTMACMSLALVAYKQRERKWEQELEREEESLK